MPLPRHGRLMWVSKSKAAWEARGWRSEVGSEPRSSSQTSCAVEREPGTSPRGSAAVTRRGACCLSPTPWPLRCASRSRLLRVGSRARLLLPATRACPSCPVPHALSLARSTLSSGAVLEERRRGVGVDGALGVPFSIRSTGSPEALSAEAGAGHPLPAGPALALTGPSSAFQNLPSLSGAVTGQLLPSARMQCLRLKRFQPRTHSFSNSCGTDWS